MRSLPDVMVASLLRLHHILGTAVTIWLTVTGSLVQTQASLASDLRLELTDTAPEVVFDPARNGCSLNDIPDAAARAFRDANGLIHLVAAHFENRQFVGPSF